MSLLEVLRDADERHEDAGLALFRATTTEDSRRVAWLLAVGLDLTETDLAHLLPQLWQGLDIARALAELSMSPFAETTTDGLHVVKSAQPSLVDDFFSAEKATALRAHVLLAELEAARQTTASDTSDHAPDGRTNATGHEQGSPDAWFSAARHAYYVAAVSPSDSLDQFVDAFADPPHFDPDGARQWLTSLVLRQEARLGSERRKFALFRAYDAYTRGDPSLALGNLRAISDAGAADTYAAFALYLTGVIEGTRSNPQTVTRSHTTLATCIRLSEELHLLENEVNARRSLCETILHRINVDDGLDAERSRQLLDNARDLAHENEARVDAYGSEFLAARNVWTSARLAWTVLAFQSHTRAEIEDEGERIVRMLTQARATLIGYADVRAVILTSRDAAAIFAAFSRVPDAIREIEVGLRATEWGDAPAALLRLEDVAKGLREQTDSEHRDKLDDLLRRIADRTSVFG